MKRLSIISFTFLLNCPIWTEDTCIILFSFFADFSTDDRGMTFYSWFILLSVVWYYNFVCFSINNSLSQNFFIFDVYCFRKHQCKTALMWCCQGEDSKTFFNMCGPSDENGQKSTVINITCLKTNVKSKSLL